MSSPTAKGANNALLELGASVAALEGPSLRVDMLIWRALDMESAAQCLDIDKQPVPWDRRYTHCLDAALTLVPQDAELHLSRYRVDRSAEPMWSAEIGVGRVREHDRQVLANYAATPALALCAAALSAVTAQGIETAKPPKREAGSARKGESPVAESHAPESPRHG